MARTKKGVAVTYTKGQYYTDKLRYEARIKELQRQLKDKDELIKEWEKLAEGVEYIKELESKLASLEVKKQEYIDDANNENRRNAELKSCQRMCHDVLLPETKYHPCSNCPLEKDPKKWKPDPSGKPKPSDWYGWVRRTKKRGRR